MEVVKCKVLLARDYVLILVNATAHDRGHKKNLQLPDYYFHWNATYSQPAVITSRSDREMSRAAGQQEICINFKMKKCWSHFNYLNFVLCLNGDFTCTLQLTSERICESQSSSFRMHCSASASGHCVLWLQLLLWKPFFCSAFSTVGSSQNPCFFFPFKTGTQRRQGYKERWTEVVTDTGFRSKRCPEP